MDDSFSELEIFDAVSALRSGPAAWGEYRAGRGAGAQRLSGLRLGGDMSVVDTDYDQPFDCNLAEYDFSEIQFSNCKFEDCNLERANFSGSSLSDSEFRRCSLREVDFSAALILRTTLVLCDLDGARFDGAEMGDNALLKLDLSKASGLAGRSARFASSIGVDTLVRTLAGGNALSNPGLFEFFKANKVPVAYLDAGGSASR
jgi:hypothetical protein